MTIIVVTFALLLLFPVAASAVTSSFFLADPHNTNHAAIDAAGNVQTKVNGGVQTRGNLALPTEFVRSNGFALGTAPVPVLQPSSGRALVVTSVHLDWDGQDPTTDQFASITIADASTCNNPSGSLAQFFDIPDAQNSVVVPFTPGYIVPAGKALCAIDGLTTGFVGITVFGYKVSSTLAPFAAPAATPGSASESKYRNAW